MPSQIRAFIAAAALAAGLLHSDSATAQGEPPSPHHILARVSVGPGEAERIAALDYDRLGVAADRLAVDFRVSQAELEELRAGGFDVELLDPNMYDTWDRVSRLPGFSVDGPWGEYHNLESANEFLDDLNAAFPHLTAPVEIGDSLEGRAIRGLRISSSSTMDPGKPALFVTGCHHAREWISVEVPLYIAEQLVSGYGSDPEITALLDRGEVWVFPVINPDGYKYTEIDRLWRKNRRDNGNGTFGVDLNRNYSYEWGLNSGSSGSTGSQTYRGTAPFSEPETRAVRDAFDLRDFAAGLTYHNYGELVMSPWGYTTSPPPGSARMEGLAADVRDGINAVHGRSYTSGRWGVELYLGSGIFVDWVFGVRGVPALIVELRGPFTLAASQILPTVEENFDGFKVMANQIFFDWCYADCDRSTGTGVLDVFDFLCFQDNFVNGAGFVCDCDTSTGMGVCDIFDFLCFQDAFASGCP
jgi:hypothetical protein